MSADALTFARAVRSPAKLAKAITVEAGAITGTMPSPNAFLFAFREVAIGSLDDLLASLEEAAAAGEIAVRAAPKAPQGRRAIHDDAKKGPAGLDVAPRRWCAFDWDGIDPEDTGADPLHDPEAGARLALRRLPHAFRDVSCLWQVSASAGFQPGFRMRTWHLLDNPTFGAELKVWIAPAIKRGLVDPVTLVECQPTYLGVRVVGGPDPCPRRFGVLRLARDQVKVPDIEAIRGRQQAREQENRQQRRRNLADFNDRHREDHGDREPYAQARIDDCLAAIRSATARHTTYMSEAARARAICERYGLKWAPIRRALIAAYEATLTPQEAKQRQNFSTEGVLDWIEGRP